MVCLRGKRPGMLREIFDEWWCGYVCRCRSIMWVTKSTKNVSSNSFYEKRYQLFLCQQVPKMCWLLVWVVTAQLAIPTRNSCGQVLCTLWSWLQSYCKISGNNLAEYNHPISCNLKSNVGAIVRVKKLWSVVKMINKSDNKSYFYSAKHLMSCDEYFGGRRRWC